MLANREGEPGNEAGLRALCSLIVSVVAVVDLYRMAESGLR